MVHVNPALTLSGSVAIEGGGTVAGARIWLDSGEARWLRGGGADVNADGSYVWPVVDPGVFLVQAAVRPAGSDPSWFAGAASYRSATCSI